MQNHARGARPAVNTNVDSYDNKLVSSTLSALNPTTTGVGGNHSPISAVFSPNISSASTSAFATTNVGLGLNAARFNPSYQYHSSHPYSNNALPSRSYVRNGSASLAGGLGAVGGKDGKDLLGTRGGVLGVEREAHPSHPSSPWTVVTLTILPIFNGTPLLTPLEDLNSLVSAHIQSAIHRSPQAYRSLLSSDLQELISSGMLTLKSKLDAVHEHSKLIARVGEVWNFFFSIVPYLQGAFLPLSLLKSDPSTDSPEMSQQPNPISTNVRHLLLSGFLLHIVLPIRSRLLDALRPELYHFPVPIGPSKPTSPISVMSNSLPPPPTADQLGRLQHMALIISTQARSSSFLSNSAASARAGRDRSSSGSSMAGAVHTGEEKDEADRKKVEDIYRAIVRLKNGGKDANADSRSSTKSGLPASAGTSSQTGTYAQPGTADKKKDYFAELGSRPMRRNDGSSSTSGLGSRHKARVPSQAQAYIQTLRPHGESYEYEASPDLHEKDGTFKQRMGGMMDDFGRLDVFGGRGPGVTTVLGGNVNSAASSGATPTALGLAQVGKDRTAKPVV